MKKSIAPNEPGMPRTAELHQGDRRTRSPAERTDEGLLSEDAMAADPYGEGLSGIPPLEAEPTAQDILPDQVYRRRTRFRRRSCRKASRGQQGRRLISPEALGSAPRWPDETGGALA